MKSSCHSRGVMCTVQETHRLDLVPSQWGPISMWNDASEKHGQEGSDGKMDKSKC